MCHHVTCCIYVYSQQLLMLLSFTRSMLVIAPLTQYNVCIHIILIYLLWLVLVFTTRSELWKVLFLAPSVCGFLCMKYLWNRWTGLCQIYTEDWFGPSLRRVWRSKVKVTGTKMNFLALLVACVWFVFHKTSLTSSCLLDLPLVSVIHSYCLLTYYCYSGWPLV